MKIKNAFFKNTVLIISLLIYFYLIFVGRNQYIFNMSYAKCIVFILLICLLIYLYGIIENKDKIYKMNIDIYILLYFILLISVTFFIGRPNIMFYKWWYTGQYEPFYTIASQLHYGSKLSIIKNLLGNSIMLMPLSFLLMVKKIKYKNVFKQSIIILPITISIEILQAFTHTGAFDIDDIILNYLGTIIFTFFITRFFIIDKIRKLFYMDYQIKEKNKYILFYLSSSLLIIYIGIITFKLF